MSNTITFPGADASAATAARDSVATALSGNNVADYFGSSFGQVTVSSVQSTTAANPTGNFDSLNGTLMSAHQICSNMYTLVSRLTLYRNVQSKVELQQWEPA